MSDPGRQRARLLRAVATVAPSGPNPADRLGSSLPFPPPTSPPPAASSAQRKDEDCASSTSIPVIDIAAFRESPRGLPLAPGAEAVVRQWAEAFQTFGFAQVLGHGVPDEVIVFFPTENPHLNL